MAVPPGGLRALCASSDAGAEAVAGPEDSEDSQRRQEKPCATVWGSQALWSSSGGMTGGEVLAGEASEEEEIHPWKAEAKGRGSLALGDTSDMARV